jgi:isochorismate synthase EntC
LTSAKDAAEHACVVRALQSRLAPFCASLEVPSAPSVRSLATLLHLRTPLEGKLARATHVLELVEALHPSPAVGGEPRGAAVEWLRASEPVPRGWYAGPVGWFDAQGDGEFAVAIRSGRLEGERAWAYAGAGLVAGSTPASEYAETALKQRGFLSALGVQDATHPRSPAAGARAEAAPGAQP